MRGYDGDDISQEHIEAKNRIQNLECQIFKELVGNNFVGAQVEDVFGINQLMLEANPVKTGSDLAAEDCKDGLGLYTPQIIADDCSSVFLVVNYKMWTEFVLYLSEIYCASDIEIVVQFYTFDQSNKV